MRWLVTIIFIAVTTACSPALVRDPSSPFYTITVGSVLQLNQPVEFAPQQVSVFMQHGRLLAEALLDRYQPYCKLELYPMSEAARRVAPDSFVIEKVVDETELTTQSPADPAAGLLASLMLVSDTPSIYTYATHLYLHSDIQPEVYRLSCMHWEDVQDDNYLTVAQIREAMGDLFTLELAQ